MKDMMPYIPVMPMQPVLANAYVPYQYMCEVYEPDKALEKGTMFPELDDFDWEVKM